jgi:NTP-dependent ternary system trypsin peptidase co-occuring protein
VRRILRFPLSDGGEVAVEVDDATAGVGRAGRVDDAANRAAQTYEQAMASVRQAAEATVRQFRQLTSSPSTVELLFGIKLTAEAGAVIARTKAEAHLTVRLTWTGEGS